GCIVSCHFAHTQVFGMYWQLSGYVFDLADRSNMGLSFSVQTYPDGIPPGAAGAPPAATAFAFHILASATPLTPDEFVAQQRQQAAQLRQKILADPTASSSLRLLAADATTWTDLYLTALTQAGLLRPVDQPPEVRDDPLIASMVATLASGI